MLNSHAGERARAGGRAKVVYGLRAAGRKRITTLWQIPEPHRHHNWKSTYSLITLCDLGTLIALSAEHDALLTGGEQLRPSTRSRMLYWILVFLERTATLRTLLFRWPELFEAGLAHVVPRKGLVHVYGAEMVFDNLKRLGHEQVVLKGDSEPALKSVEEDVRLCRDNPTLLEHSGVGQPQSNGVVG